MRSSINDVMVLGGMGQGICDDSPQALVIKRLMKGEGFKNCSKLSDVNCVDDPYCLNILSPKSKGDK